MSVNSKMKAIADAIREKTGGTTPLTLDQMATEIAGIETGGTSFYSGSFTPAENVLSIDIDVGGAFTMFLLHTKDTVTGLGIRAARGLIFDSKDDYINILSTNNSGTATAGIFQPIDHRGGAVGGNGNCRITAAGTVFSVNSTLTTGNCPGYFLQGVNYEWYAW